MHVKENPLGDPQHPVSETRRRAPSGCPAILAQTYRPLRNPSP